VYSYIDADFKSSAELTMSVRGARKVDMGYF
jgi:hypothetical protein